MSRTTKDMPPELGLRRRIERERRAIRLQVRRVAEALPRLEPNRLERLT